MFLPRVFGAILIKYDQLPLWGMDKYLTVSDLRIFNSFGE